MKIDQTVENHDDLLKVVDNFDNHGTSKHY